MHLSFPILIRVMALLSSQLASAQFPRLGAQKCTDIFEGRGCLSPGGRLCCEEDLINIISCDKKTKTIKYFHCTGGRICDPDGKGDIGCFIPGTQPTPPKGLGRRARGDGDVGVVEREEELEGPGIISEGWEMSEGWAEVQ